VVISKVHVFTVLVVLKLDGARAPLVHWDCSAYCKGHFGSLRH